MRVRILCTTESQTANRLPNLFVLSPGFCLSLYLLLTYPSTMLFTIVLLALATAGPVFSAPVPSTELTLRQEPADAAVKRRDDTLSTGPPHRRSKRLVPRLKTPERVQRARDLNFNPLFKFPPIPKPSNEAPPSGSGDSVTPSRNPEPVEGSPGLGETGVGPAVGSGDIVGDLEDPAEDDGDEGMRTILDILPRLY